MVMHVTRKAKHGDDDDYDCVYAAPSSDDDGGKDDEDYGPGSDYVRCRC